MTTSTTSPAESAPSGRDVAVATSAEPDSGGAIPAAQPVMLVRYRPGLTGQSARTVHLVPVPQELRAGAAAALCGAVLCMVEIEIVGPGQGMPCTACLLNEVSTPITAVGQPPAGSPDSTGAMLVGGAAYRAWGWPVTPAS